MLTMLVLQSCGSESFDTDHPDPGAERIRYGSGIGSRPHFDTDPDPGENDTDSGLGKEGFNTRKIFKI